MSTTTVLVRQDLTSVEDEAIEVWDVTCGGGDDVPDIWRLTKPLDPRAWTIQLYLRRLSDRLYSHSPLIVGTELHVVVDTLRSPSDPGPPHPAGWSFGLIIGVERIS